jgi:hypothetical protein
MKTRFSRHWGHEIVIARYTDGIEDPAYSIECETCYEVVLGDESDFED